MIYIPSIHSLTLNTQRKIEYMVRNKINKSSVCWPISAIYDNENNFRGYLFKNVEGMNLRDFVYQVKNKDDIGILNQSKTTIIEMILAILDTIVYLHHINVIIGELKLEHIIVSTNNPSKVSFIHCHNYQIGKYPCLNINDTVAPEIDINYKNNYLTYQSDYYQVFSMLFEILFKTLPYTSCNSKFIDNYLNGVFPYSLKEEETIVNGRKGYPVNNWSHIPGYLKKAFWDMGSRKGDHFEPKKRYTPIDWMRLFMSYNSDLNNNRLQNVDESYDKGYFDPSLSPVNYKVVDIPMEKTITFITKGFNLYDTIKKAFINAIIQYNDKSLQKVYDTLCSNPSYECDEYKLLLKKNIGILYYRN